jgi:hypothetical protein
MHALGLKVRLELSDRTDVSLSSLSMAPDSRRNLMLPESILSGTVSSLRGRPTAWAPDFA